MESLLTWQLTVAEQSCRKKKLEKELKKREEKEWAMEARRKKSSKWKRHSSGVRERRDHQQQNPICILSFMSV